MDAKFNIKKADGWGRNIRLQKLLAVAAARVVRGEGPFKVVRVTTDGTHYPHEGLKRADALAQFEEIARAIGTDAMVFVDDKAGDTVLRARRAAASPYKDPFRDCEYSSMRIDAGVDYTGTGKVYPIGRCKIINRGTPSMTWSFGHDMPVYQLLDGPAAGNYVFMDEHMAVLPGVNDGDVFDVDQPIWELKGAVEIGWSDGVGSYAWDKTNYGEGQLSRIGLSMSRLLEALGAKPGLVEGRRPSGPLPAQFDKDWKSLV